MVEGDAGTSPQFYEHLLQDVHEGFFILDPQDAVIAASPPAARILGYEPEALVGLPWHTFWPQELPPPGELEEGKIYPCKTQAPLHSDQVVPVAISVRPLLTGSGSQRLVSVARFGSLQRLDEALSNTQKLAGIGTLTASVAHEINTPISVITATCSNLLREVDAEDPKAERLLHYVNMIERSAWRCARIVDVLRNYTTEDGLRSAVTDLNAVIEDAVSLVWHQFQGDFNITIGLKLQDGLRSIVCDHNRLTQVVVNLLNNARDAMRPGGGHIRIKSWSVEKTPGTSGADASEAKESGEEFAFSVSDSGPGIAPERMERLFSPFFTTKPGGQGAGLGLFVAKRIVNQHGGRIWAENDASGGATFTIILPRRQARMPDQPPANVGIGF